MGGLDVTNLPNQPAMNAPPQQPKLDLEKMSQHQLTIIQIQLLAQVRDALAQQTKLLEVHGMQETTLLELVELQTTILEEAFPDEDEEEGDEPIDYVPTEAPESVPRRAALVRPGGRLVHNAPSRTIERVLDEPSHRSPYQPIDEPAPPEFIDAKDVDPLTHPDNVWFHKMCTPREPKEEKTG
jgi:hypothetical protein